MAPPPEEPQPANPWVGVVKRFYHRWIVPDFDVYRLENLATGAREVVRYVERRHVIALLDETWVAIVVAAGALGGAVAVERELVQIVLAVVYVVALLYFLFRLVDWSVTRFYVTDYRLVELAGFLDTRLNEIPKTKLTDIQLRQSLVGKVLGYGTIRVETAGQDQALGVIEFIRLPAVLSVALSSYSLT